MKISMRISKLRNVIFALSMTLFFGVIIGCQEEESAFSGVKISGGNCYVEANGTIQITATYYKDDSAKKDVSVVYKIENDTTGGATFEGGVTTTGLSGTAVNVKVGDKSGLVSISATANNSTAKTGIAIRNNIISPDDSPDGFASYNASIDFGGAGGTVYEVSDRTEFLAAVKASVRKIIYVTGMIDMTDTGNGTMLPDVGSNYDHAPKALDNFVNSKTNGAYKTYADWKKAYGSVATTVDDGSSTSKTKSSYYTTLWALNNAYKQIIQINMTSNTTIIGTGENCGIRGGAISISNVSNVALRNLVIYDACDPFTHHETTSSGASDGFNAQFDGACISNSCKNIWIDHCTFADTMKLASAPNGEKWQVYDGLLDMKQSADYVTVSNCFFHDHDKTMLIGSSDSDKSVNNGGYRTITLHHNYFLNCGQRLPMVRWTKNHVYNNVYDRNSSASYSSQSTINCRNASLVVQENNYFGSVASISTKDGIYTSSPSKSTFNPNDWYSYVVESTSAAKSFVLSNAGAGKCEVKR